MRARPDPPVMRAAARGLLRAAEELDHDATTARGTVAQLETRWVGSAAVQHASAVGDYLRGLGAAAAGLREVALQTTLTAAQLEGDLADLTRLELRSAALGATGPAVLNTQIEQLWERIRAHRLRWARAIDQVEVRCDSGRQMRCGPARRADFSVDPGPRMRTGPVHRIVQAWSGGSGGYQIVVAHRSVVAP